MRPELHSLPLLPETPKREVHSERDSLAAFASANPEMPLAIRQLPEKKPSAEVKRLLSAVVRLVAANRRLLEHL
jgi:hypothetical protein